MTTKRIHTPLRLVDLEEKLRANARQLQSAKMQKKPQLLLKLKRERNVISSQIWCRKHPKIIKRSRAKTREKYKLKRRAYSRNYYTTHREAYRAAKRAYGAANADKLKLFWKARASSPTYKAKRSVRLKLRLKTDVVFAITRRLRCRLYVALLGKAKKFGKTMELTGCSKEELMLHIESQFRKGMTWQNRNLWHLDHRRPISAFDLTDPKQQRECAL